MEMLVEGCQADEWLPTYGCRLLGRVVRAAALRISPHALHKHTCAPHLPLTHLKLEASQLDHS